MKKNELRTIFSANLKKLLKDKNINRKELSKQLYISYSRICDWSRARTLPTSEELVSIAEYFNVRVEDLTKDISIISNTNNEEYSFNDIKQTVRIYNLSSGNVIGHDEVCCEYFKDIDAVHISFVINDDLMYPNYSINDVVLVENIWKPNDLEDGDYLITKDNSFASFIHVYNKKDYYLISPLNINNSKGLIPYEIKKDEIKNYKIYKAIAVTKKI